METITTKVVIDPMTRIEGHLKIEAILESGKVVEANCGATLYRGFEQILIGRNPLDAVQITQRFCGVCPAPHAVASAQALDNALGLVPPKNGRIIRNIIAGANLIQSHVLHFYHLASLDYYRGPDVPPFYPRYEADYRIPKPVHETLLQHYVQAYQIRLKAHELGGIWAGKLPHAASIVPGGVTITPRLDNITTSLWRLKELREFIDNVYIPDVLMIAEVYRDYFIIGRGCTNFLAFGLLDLDDEPDVMKRRRYFPMACSTNGTIDPVDPKKIMEDVKFSWYSSASHLGPKEGETEPNPHKPGSYSWLKSPRYADTVYEVGPLARMLMLYRGKSNPTATKLIDNALARLQIGPEDLPSVMGRHIARALECKLVADEMESMIMDVTLDAPVCQDYKIPVSAEGMGLWGAARGALGHWISIRNGKIARYQAVVPTTWNASPKDDRGTPGPIEQAMIGTEIDDVENPFALARIVRSFDPCIACAVHLLEPGRPVKKFRIL